MFFQIWFILTCIIFASQIYYNLKNKPLKQKLAEAERKIEELEIIINNYK